MGGDLHCKKKEVKTFGPISTQNREGYFKVGIYRLPNARLRYLLREVAILRLAITPRGRGRAQSPARQSEYNCDNQMWCVSRLCSVLPENVATTILLALS